MRFDRRPAAVLAALVVTAATGTAAARAQTPSHVYELANSLSDALGGPALVNNDAALTPTGLTFAPNQGPTLTGAVNAATYSIEMYFQIDAVDDYRKLIDFKNRGADAGLYNWNGNLLFYNIGGATSGGVVIGENTPIHLLVTRDDATNLFTGYINGQAEFSFTDSGGAAVFSGANQVAHFLRDDSAVSGEAAGGYLEYIRIYDTVLTAGEAQQRFDNRGTFTPNATSTAVPESGTLPLVLGGLLSAPVLGFVARRRRAR